MPVKVTTNQCTISVNSDANAGKWINVDDLTFASGTSGTSNHGADISSVAKGEAKDGVYQTGSGAAGDPVAILKSAGMNYARLKARVNPVYGYKNLTHVLAMAKRIKAQDMLLLVDFTTRTPGPTRAPGPSRPSGRAIRTVN